MLAGGAPVCGLGTLMSATAETLGPAYLGRLLIGGSGGFAFVATMKPAGTWFPPRRFALMSGLAGMMGMAGAVAGQAPLAAVVAVFGWRDTLSASAVFGIALAVAIWLVVRDGAGPKAPPPTTGAGLLYGLRQVARNPQSWIIGTFSAAISSNIRGHNVLCSFNGT